VEGEVVVQAFTPSHAAIQFARRHDFEGYYEQEMEWRRELRYPPFSRIALLTLKGPNEEAVRFSSEHLKKEILSHTQEITDLRLKGPAPAPIVKKVNQFEYQIMLQTRNMPRLSHCMGRLLKAQKWPNEMRLSVNIDPVDMG
jgi:primosomal protein N' (replication factor Y)